MNEDSPKRSLEKALENLVVITAGLLAFLVPAYFSLLDPDWHHDGIMFKPAADVAAGLTLFKETFFQYGALTAYLHALGIKVFGKYLLVIRLEAALFLSLSGLMIFLLTRRISGRFIAAFAVLIWLSLAPYMGSTLLPWSSIYALFFVSLGALLLILAIDLDEHRKSALWLSFAAGISISAAFWARQPVGIMFPIGFSIFLIFLLDRSLNRRTLVLGCLAYMVGFFLLTLLLLAFIFFEDAITDWWKQSFVGASSFTNEMTNVDESFFEDLFHHLIPWTPTSNRIKGLGGGFIWSLLPIVSVFSGLFFFALLIIRRHLASPDRNLLIVCTFATGMWHQYYPVSASWQIYWGASLMLIPAVSVTFRLAMLFTSSWRFSPILGLLVLSLLFGEEINQRVILGLKAVPQSPILIPSLEGMWATKRFAERNKFKGEASEYSLELNRLGETLEQIRDIDPDRPLITLGEDLLLAASLAEKTPGPVTAGWYWLTLMYPNHNDSLKTFIRTEQPIVELKERSKPPYAHLTWESSDSSNIAIRKEFGLDKYDVLLRTNYADSGTSLILAPKGIAQQIEKQFGKLELNNRE